MSLGDLRKDLGSSVSEQLVSGNEGVSNVTIYSQLPNLVCLFHVFVWQKAHRKCLEKGGKLGS